MKFVGITYKSSESARSWRNDSTYPVIHLRKANHSVWNVHIKGLFGAKGGTWRTRWKWIKHYWNLLFIRSWREK